MNVRQDGGVVEPNPEALAFDVYGTLVDPIGIRKDLERHLPAGDAAEVAEVWRRKQLEISFRLTAMERYEDFEWCTRRGLDYALAAAGRRLDPGVRDALIARYDHLEPFADAPAALSELRDRGHVLSVLSNGTPRMLAAVLDSSGLRPYFTEVISADEVRAFKPSPRPYLHGAERLGRPPAELRLISSNPFDIIGARSAGLHAAWVDRAHGLFEADGAPPDVVVTTLADLPGALSP